MTVLTDRKRAVLRTVADHIADHGYPP
ncbi:MAG: hypothetical protein JWN52_6606, partial [Actinomycetia bacterium]|nr:hypothetical protein [Actinomycetes bacterium]